MRKILVFLFIILTISSISSNEKNNTNSIVQPQRSNILKGAFNFNNLNIFNNKIFYNEDTKISPELTKAASINLIVSGGILLGGGVIIAALGGICVGPLYSMFRGAPTAESFIIIGAASFAIGGLFLIGGIVLIAVGAYVFNKHYKKEKVSFFIDSKNNHNQIGLSFKL